MLFRKKARCFYDDFDAKQGYSVIQIGLRVIEIAAVIGTVDKCGEMDRKFKYINRWDRHERYRRFRIQRATKALQFFPPISVNRFQGYYYVVDGHRRVAACIESGIDYIDAEIKEYVLQKNPEVLNGVMARKRFEAETGLKNIRLKRDEGYSLLLTEVENYPKGETLKEKGEAWSKERYYPLCNAIEESVLPSHYSDLHTGDIYVLLVSFYNDFMDGTPKDISHATIISGYLFARKIKTPRIYRIPILGLIFRLFRRHLALPE